MEKVYLHKLIEKYYEGAASLEEEEVLVKELLKTQERDQKMEEALGVLAFTHFPSREITQNSRPKKYLRVCLRIAAIFVAVLAITSLLLFIPSPEDNEPTECLMYVNGKYVKDPQSVKLLIEQQLNDIKIASNKMDNAIFEDLKEFDGLFNTNEP